MCEIFRYLLILKRSYFINGLNKKPDELTLDIFDRI